MSEEHLKKVAFDASYDLVIGVQAGRDAGRRFKDKKFSNRLAYEIGAKILLEIPDEEEEEAIDQELADLDIQEAMINSRRKLLSERKEKRKANKKKVEEESIQTQQEIVSLASKIREYWQKITVYKEKKCIGYIVNAFPKLTREKVASVFPDSIVPVPSEEEAYQIASDLLGVEL